MAMAFEIFTRTYNSEFFDSIDADSSDVEFQQITTFGCLSSLLTWAKNKHQLLKSSRSSESSNAIFTGLRFEVKQASRGLSAIAELHVMLS